MKDWRVFGRADQKPPPGDWLVWLMLGGRGAGKTRAGAEWVRALATAKEQPAGPIALVGESFADVREVMIEGVSGLLRAHTSRNRPEWQRTRRRLVWPNGTVAQAFSAEDPEALRGPQFSAAWADELGKWRYPDAAWDMLQFGLRLGERPRQVVTTTPRPIPLLKRLIAERGERRDGGQPRDHGRQRHEPRAGIPEPLVARYHGTRLGRQELLGEMIEDRADALWRRDTIEAGRVTGHPPLGRIVVAVDPPASRRSGTCGIVAAGLVASREGADGIAYVLADASLAEVRPAEWAAAAIALYRRLDADALVAEINQGGDMVAAVMREVDAGVPVKEVRATRGKWLRAEPVAALYAQGRVRHVGALPELEDEMCDFGIDGLSAGRSPDRLDALVWALTALMLGEGGEPRVRGVVSRRGAPPPFRRLLKTGYLRMAPTGDRDRLVTRPPALGCPCGASSWQPRGDSALWPRRPTSIPINHVCRAVTGARVGGGRMLRDGRGTSWNCLSSWPATALRIQTCRACPERPQSRDSATSDPDDRIALLRMSQPRDGVATKPQPRAIARQGVTIIQYHVVIAKEGWDSRERILRGFAISGLRQRCGRT